MEVVIAALIAWIVANTGMVAPPPPPVLYVPQAHLQEMLYGEKGTNRGSVRALYAHSQATIYLAEGWRGDNIFELGQLLHELVHHVQKFNNLPAPCLAAYERQAYDLHIAWLRERGVEDPYGLLNINELTIMLLTRCPWSD